MRSLRSRLSYANVISTLCLFMLLGGGAYAAGGGLAKNSVGTKQLKNGAITGKKIKKGTIDSSKLTAETVASLQGGQGERGAAGPMGADGPQGEPGDPGAYATIEAAETPVFIGSHPGFLAVERLTPTSEDPVEKEKEAGIYCLTPEPGTNIDHPIGSAEGSFSAGAAFFIDPYAAERVVKCGEGLLEVHTYKMQRPNGEEEPEPPIPAASNDASFSVFVPGP
jgi:hypothetical protein